MSTCERSCIDCAAVKCDYTDGKYPDFCLTAKMDPEVLADAMASYEDSEIRRIAQTAADVEHEGYLKWTRLEETMEFARRMGYQKIGIATCVGLLRESRKLAQILRAHDFEVFGVACKCGAQPKGSIGCLPECDEQGVNMCNPVLQAKLLNNQQTDFNILMGLCVGHDSLLYKHSYAPVTTLVAKDRVLAHNPTGALYLADGYYKRVKG